MPKAIQSQKYGGIGVSVVVDIGTLHLNDNDVVVQVKVAGINPGEAKIRQGLMQ